MRGLSLSLKHMRTHAHVVIQKMYQFLILMVIRGRILKTDVTGEENAGKNKSKRDGIKKWNMNFKG